MDCTNEGDRLIKRDGYKEARFTTKMAVTVAEAKSLVYENFYKKLDTKERERERKLYL